MIERAIDCPECFQKHLSQSPQHEYTKDFPFNCAGCGAELKTSGSLPTIVLKEAAGDWEFHDSIY